MKFAVMLVVAVACGVSAVVGSYGCLIFVTITSNWIASRTASTDASKPGGHQQDTKRRDVRPGVSANQRPSD